MANYSLIANSTFQPFSYQELMAPVARMSDVHSAIAEQYDKLSSQADVLEAMGNNDRDKGSGTYGRYKAYSDALRAEAENLYRNGLDINSRMRLSDLRRRYNQVIVPIQNAWNKREQEADVQMKARLQNPSLRFTRDASTSTLDDYLANPTGGYGVVNLNAITADMAAAAKTLEGQIKRGAKVEGVDSTTYNYIQQYGLSDSMISEWIKNPESNSALTNMMNQVLAKHGVTEQALAGTQNGAAILAEGRQAAQLGAWHSMGQDRSQLHTNEAAKMALQYQYREREAENDFNRRVRYAQMQGGIGAGGNGAGSHAVINPLPLRSPQEIDENNKRIQKYIDNGYFVKDSRGRYRMTHEGFEAMRDVKNPSVGTASKKRDQEFYDFIVGLNRGKSFMDTKGNPLPGWGGGRAGDLFNLYVNANNEGSYDTYHTTEFDRQITGDYSGAFTNQMWSAATKNGKASVDVVEFNGKNGWNKKDKLGKKELDGYKVTNVRYSKYGNTAILQKDGEEPIRVLLPKGMNYGAERNTNAAALNAADIATVLAKGKRPQMSGNTFQYDKNGNLIFTNENLTSQDRQYLMEYQREALDELYSYGSQFAIPSTTKADEYKPFAF